MKWGKYAIAGRLLQLDLGIDGQSEILKFHPLLAASLASHRHACRLTIRNYSEV